MITVGFKKSDRYFDTLIFLLGFLTSTQPTRESVGWVERINRLKKTSQF